MMTKQEIKNNIGSCLDGGYRGVRVKGQRFRLYEGRRTVGTKTEAYLLEDKNVYHLSETTNIIGSVERLDDFVDVVYNYCRVNNII